MNRGPALAALELRSIARGYVALDAACKRAWVTVLRAEPISPGKYWFLLGGGEAEVEEALHAAIDRAAESHLDHVWLPSPHAALMEALTGAGARAAPSNAVGALELGSMAATIRAADAALKAADVCLVDLHLARGIGGKGYVVLCGSLSDVEAAVAAGDAAAGDGWLVGREVIANPDAAAASALSRVNG